MNRITSIFEALSVVARLQILLVIGTGEACVCHIESNLGLRQAYISQQLMILRESGILTSRRDGKYIYYRLQDASILDLIRHASQLAGVPGDQLVVTASDTCECPHCQAPIIPENDLDIR